MDFSIDKHMLPMKGHFFLYNAGTAPLVPYLPTYAKQLGFSTYITGIIYLFLPIFGMFAKPLFGAIADKYEKHKFIFILFQILTISAFTGLYFVPESTNQANVRLTCGDGESFFSACPKNVNKGAEDYTVKKLISLDGTTKCHMSCSMNSPYMWQTVCEHWKVPKYCYSKKAELNFIATLPTNKISQIGDCAYFQLDQAKMPDGLQYVPRCSAKTDETLRTTCSMFCPHKRITTFLSDKDLNLFCEQNKTVFNSCSHPKEELQTFVKSFENESGEVECSVICNMDSPIKWLDFCLGWGADETRSCHPTEKFLPNTFNFVGVVPLNKTIREGDCVYFKLQSAILPDDTIHYPQCPKFSRLNHFNSNCSTWCEHYELNDLLTSHSMGIKRDEDNLDVKQFSIFFSLMILNWVGMAVVVSIADAICFEMLGNKPEKYGRQRLWGSVGWGIFSLITGILIDQFSKTEENKNYLVAFILMFVFLLLDVLVSSKLKYKQKSISVNIFRKVGVLFKSLRTCHFFIWIIFVGMCTGLQWQFLFWYLEDLAEESTNQGNWIKTLQGLVNILQCFLGEIPFLFFSGRILKKIGHVHTMSLILLGFGIRFVLYSLLTNPWWVLPIECLQGVTFGLLFATMASYASLIAPDGTEATIQGLVGAVFEGIGTSLGSFIGGIIYNNRQGAFTFRVFGCAALVICLINVFVTQVFLRKTQTPTREDRNQEYSSIIRYAAPNDALDMLNDHQVIS